MPNSRFKVKELIKQFLPHGLCEYSVRRHTLMEMGIPAALATRKAISRRVYDDMLDARLNLLPREILGSLRTCVDGGAHKGRWTRALLSLFQPERVIMVECAPPMLAGLEQYQDVPGIQIVNKALAEKEGTAKFYMLGGPAASSLLEPLPETQRYYRKSGWEIEDECEVRTVTYDALVEAESKVSILKLDLQGSERYVLAASSDGLRKTQSIIIEANFFPHYRKGSTFSDIDSLLREKGFGLYRISAVYHRGGRALFADAVYVREEICRKLS